MTGRLPGPVHAVFGTKIVPVTAIGRPRRSVEEYMTRVALTVLADSLSGSSSSGASADRMIWPGVPGMSAGGS